MNHDCECLTKGDMNPSYQEKRLLNNMLNVHKIRLALTSDPGGWWQAAAVEWQAA
jgi:hypothetical protein